MPWFEKWKWAKLVVICPCLNGAIFGTLSLQTVNKVRKKNTTLLFLQWQLCTCKSANIFPCSRCGQWVMLVYWHVQLPRKGIVITNAQCMIIDPSQSSLSFALALHWMLPYLVCPCMGCSSLVSLHGLCMACHGRASSQLWCVIALEIESRGAAKFNFLQLLYIA